MIQKNALAGLSLILGLSFVPVTAFASGEPEAEGSGIEEEASFVIGFAMPTLSHSYWIPMLYGVTTEAEKYGMEVIDLNAGGFGNVDAQTNQVENLIQRGVDAIIIGATSGEGMVPAVERAIDAGIPVFGVGSQPRSDRVTTKVFADDYGMGELQARCLGEAIGGSGEVAMMSGPAGNNWSMDRAQGFRDTMAEMYPDVEIVAEQWTDISRPKATELMETWIQRFPDLAGLYTANDDLAAGAIGAMVSAGVAGQVKVSSSNPTDIGIEYMKEGYIVCEAVQQTVMQGQKAVEAAYITLTGGTPESRIVTPALLLTADNLNTFDYSTVRHPDGFEP